jgi:hypothetical protein
MSLRNQIHKAVDDVAPPVPALEHRVKAFVLSDGQDGRRARVNAQPRWVAPVGLIAAALVLAVVAGLFIGGRFWRTQNAPPSTVSATELKTLESRSLHYPVVTPGAPCPSTPLTLNQNLGMVHGAGPVYVIDSEIYQSSDWGNWVELRFAYDGQKPGLVLVRAQDLQSEAEFVFVQYPLAPTGVTAVGPVVGDVHLLGHDLRLRSEAVFRDRNMPPNLGKPGQPPALLVLVGLQKGSSGCIGFQVDGPGFTENFVIGPGGP